jgi:hypothetical protein
MSQFQTNFGFNQGQQGYETLNSLAQFPGPFSQQAPRPAGRVFMQSPNAQGAQPVGGYQRYQSSVPSPVEPATNRGPGGSFATGLVPQQSLNWDQMLANAMRTDMSQQQGAMTQMHGALAGQIGQYERDMLGGLDAFGRQSAQQYQNLQGIAGGLEQQGRDVLQRTGTQVEGLMRDVTQRVDRSEAQAGEAVDTAQQMVSQFRDTSAQDAANLAFGMRRNVQAAMKEIDTNPDMTPAERQAARFQLYSETESQVTQNVSSMFSRMNDRVADLQGQLSQVQMARSATTQQGAGIIGQVGTAMGQQRLESERMNLSMQELGASIRASAEQAAASAQMQSTMALLQGRQTLYEMIQGNPQQFVSQFAGLTGYLVGASTPGLNRISIPNFGLQA